MIGNGADAESAAVREMATRGVERQQRLAMLRAAASRSNDRRHMTSAAGNGSAYAGKAGAETIEGAAWLLSEITSGCFDQANARAAVPRFEPR